MTHKKKSASIKRSPSKMSMAAPNKTRLVLSCTEEEKMYIKMLAASQNKTMSEYLISRSGVPQSRCDFPGCNGIHKPNKLTEKILKESERGENLEHHESIEDF
jgi:hypothetical protein